MSSNAQPFCPNCFSEKTDGNPVCSKCGYDDRAYRSPAVLPPGTVLNDQYVVGRVLGSPGGFGITYLCWDRRLTTRVAIKEFIPRENAVRDRDGCSVVAHSEKDMDSFAYGLKAFLSEARTVAGFNHPNIVRVRTYFEQHRTGYMVMDYYEGISLADYVKQQGGRLPEKTAFGIMGFVLDSLRYVHQQGYLHRDVKPQNIYMTSQGQVILLDFGAARYSIGMHSKSLSVVVTQGYSPFEQYRTTGRQGPWTDVYACGATLYYLLTGVSPVEAQDRMEEDGLEPPERLVSGLSPSVSAGIMGALKVKAEERPQSIDELRGLLGSHPVTELHPDPPEQEPKPESRPKPEKKPAPPPSAKERWKNRKIQAVLAAVLVVLGFLYWNWSGKWDLVLPKVGPKIGDMWADPVTEMEFVWVPGDCYQMGCGYWTSACWNHEKPVHEACVDGFWLGKTEVTQGQWVKVMGSNPSYFKIGDNYPVEQVSWEDAKEYIRKLNGLGRAKFRLPSEAEWEYAARSGGKAEKYAGGNDVDAVAWYGSNSGNSTHPVNTKKSNGLGLYDMSGNLWEWCEDVYIEDIYGKSANSKNPIYTSGGTYRVVRGGSWRGGPDYVRCAYRGGNDPPFRYDYLGFRLLRIP